MHGPWIPTSSRMEHGYCSNTMNSLIKSNSPIAQPIPWQK
jgi:hypothetical protein